MGFFYVWRQNVDEHVGVGQRVCPSRFVASNSISNSMTHFYSHHCGTRLSRESSGQATWAATVKLSSWHHKQSLQQQSHPKPTNAAGFVQRELRWVPTSWKQADEPTEMVIQFPLNVCCNTLGAASCVQACVLNTKSKTLCVWVCVNNAVSLEGEKQKGKTSGKNSKWKL